ncbi:LOW QUALITY PROTEIN: hypothetical protein PHMEG_00028723 [Phytophthora megakarya]|uniref:Uncharacterized protein n=1 Tax=Phytophthora megakarya TaxID=4795 RepID=A0A225V4X8_9STRA|nr:LOW QUALITY PROTEIN: hypothetical protein PHMEG_00028723 [Phytophthora megakarya]
MILTNIVYGTDLREFITGNDVSDPTVREIIRIKARLLWTSQDTIYDLHFLRLYFGEHQAPESLQQQQQEFMQAQRENPFETNQFLITVSLLNVDPNNPDLPRPGSVVSIAPMKLRLYRNCPQVDAKLHGLTTVQDAS